MRSGVTQHVTQQMIAEVTPRWWAIIAARGADWSTRALRDQLLGRQVRVIRWMRLDVEHKDQAESTVPGRLWNLRTTAWRIHPMAAIEVVLRPR